MQRELFEMDIEELPLLFGIMMKVGRRPLHCKLRDNGERHPQHTNLTGVRRSIPVYS